MSKYTIKQLDRNNEKDYKLWQNGLKNFDGATIFHEPDFLGYHGEKFNEHHLGIFKGETLFGIMPMAIFIENNEVIAKSPYGASYGGAILMKTLSYKESSEIIVEIINYLKDQNINELIITPPLDILYMEYSDTFIFALLEQGAKCIKSDITSVVKVQKNNLEKFSTRNKRILKKISDDCLIDTDAPLEDFWMLIEKTFKKHGTKPTHTFSELSDLKYNKNLNIKFPIIYFKNKPIAGIGEFRINNQLKMSFYICQDDEYKDLNYQTLLINNLLDNSFLEGTQYYDFGTSSVNMVARANIFEFKEGFAAVGKFRHTYKLEIN